jgi:CIC family chloride channel protein
LSAGGIGGVFAPSMFTGALSGYILAMLINFSGIIPYELPLENFALVGMAGAIAGIIQAPLMAIFLIMEITGGHELIIPLMMVSALSFFITKKVTRFNLYTIQLKDKDAIPTHDKDKLAGMRIELNRVIEKDFIPVYPEMTLGEMVYNVITRSSRNLFPVLDENKHLAGIITLDDVRQMMFNRDLYDSIRMKDIMHQAPALIYYGKDNFQQTMRKFQSTGAWNLPIVRPDGTYIGFISKSKLLSIYRKKLLEITEE